MCFDNIMSVVAPILIIGSIMLMGGFAIVMAFDSMTPDYDSPHYISDVVDTDLGQAIILSGHWKQNSKRWIYEVVFIDTMVRMTLHESMLRKVVEQDE